VSPPFRAGVEADGQAARRIVHAIVQIAGAAAGVAGRIVVRRRAGRCAGRGGLPAGLAIRRSALATVIYAGGTAAGAWGRPALFSTHQFIGPRVFDAAHQIAGAIRARIVRASGARNTGGDGQREQPQPTDATHIEPPGSRLSGRAPGGTTRREGAYASAATAVPRRPRRGGHRAGKLSGSGLTRRYDSAVQLGNPAGYNLRSSAFCGGFARRLAWERVRHALERPRDGIGHGARTVAECRPADRRGYGSNARVPGRLVAPGPGRLAAPLMRKPRLPPTDGMQKTDARVEALGVASTGPVCEPISSM